MKKEAKEIGHGKKVMTYKNINTRVVKLFNIGLLEEVEQTGRSPHGRIDYKVNMNGMRELISDIIAYPEEVHNIIQYMDRFGLDKKVFGRLIMERLDSLIEVVTKDIPGMISPERERFLHKIDSKIHDKIEEALKRHGYDETTGTFNISDKSSSGKKKKPTLEK